MKILYVSNLYQSLEDLLTGNRWNTGIPSVTLPLQQLCQRHQVRLITLSSKDFPVAISQPWFSPGQLVGKVIYHKRAGKLARGLARMGSAWSLFRAVWRELSREPYDFVYCHGAQCFPGVLAAWLRRVPCGQRVYGIEDFCILLREKGKAYCLVKRTSVSLAFALPKAFLLITDDGSHGEEAYQRWGAPKSRYRFGCWLNGVEQNWMGETQPVPDFPYLFCPGRIAPEKRQDRVVKVLQLLHERGYLIPLYLAGGWEEETYRQLKEQISQAGLTGFVVFLGPVSKGRLQQLARHSVATVLFADLSNRGNVFLEAFSAGSVIVAKNDGSLDGFLIHGKNGFLADQEERAAEWIELLLRHPQAGNKIRRQAARDGKKKIPSWNTRVAREVEWVEAAGKERGRQ